MPRNTNSSNSSPSQSDTHHNYHLFSLSKLLSIKTGSYDASHSKHVYDSMNVNRDFRALSSITEDDDMSVYSVETSVTPQRSAHGASPLAQQQQESTSTAASTQSHNLHLLNDDVFNTLESTSSSITTPKPTLSTLSTPTQKPKATPQFNYDEHATPNTDSDSDFFPGMESPGRKVLRKRRKRMSIRVGEASGALDTADASSPQSSPHARSKSARSASSHRVSIKTVCNGATNGGAFHIMAIYCTNDVLILRFEVRNSIVLSSAEDHLGTAEHATLSSVAESTMESSLFGNGASADHLHMGMGRYSDTEDDDNLSIVTGSTSLNSASNSMPNQEQPHRYSQRDLEILKYRRLLRQYQYISQSQWDDHVNAGSPLPPAGNPNPTSTPPPPTLTMPAPIIRTITYFRDNNISIDEMLIDDKFLICVDKSSPHGDVYVLPLCRLIFPYVESNVWPFKVQRKVGGAAAASPADDDDHALEQQDSAPHPTDDSRSETTLLHHDNVSSMDAFSTLDNHTSISPHIHPHHQHQSTHEIPSLLDYTQFISESKSSTQENFLASLRTITKLSPKKRTFNSKKFGQISCICMWKTFLNKHYLVMGTTRGYLLFLNLHTQTDECYMTIPGSKHASIHDMCLISDPRQQYRYLALTMVLSGAGGGVGSSKNNLLTGSSARGSSSNLHSLSTGAASSITQKLFFKQTLEVKDPALHTYKNICEYKQYSQLSEASSTEGIQMNSKWDNMMFTATPLLEGEEFTHSDSTTYTLSLYQDPHKGPMLCLFNKLDNRLSLYDPQDTRFPLYIFQLNSHSTLFHVTENLLYTVQKSGELRSTPQPEHIWVISRLFANAGSGGSSSSAYSIATPSWTHGQHQATKSASVFQDFQLPPKQHIRGVLPGYHLQSVQQDADAETSALDGCIIWTQNAIYEMQQEYTPTHIFRKLLRHGLIGDKSDRFAKTFKLDIFRLYEQEADRAFRLGNYDRAFQLYDYSFITESKKVAKLMQSHRIDDVLKYLTNLLNYPQNLPLDKKQELSNLLFNSYLYKLSHRGGDDDVAEDDEDSGAEEGDLQNVTSQTQDTAPYPRSRSASNTSTKSDSSTSSARHLKYKKLSSDSPFRNSKFLERGIGSQCEVPVDPTLWKEFRRFLLDSHDYNAFVAVERLIDSGMIAMALEVANHGSIMKHALHYLLQRNYVSLSTECMDFLFQYAFAADLVAIGGGVFLHASPPNAQVKFLLEYIKRSRNDLENTVRALDEGVEEHQLFTHAELAKLIGTDDIANLDEQFSALLPYVNEEMVLLEVAQTFNPEKSLFISYDSYGFTRTTQLPDEVRRKQHERRDVLFYYPHFNLQTHAEIFLIAMIQLSALKRALDNDIVEESTTSHAHSLHATQKKVSDASPGSFSHAYLYRHTQEKLEQNIQFCSHLYRAQLILSHCMRYKNIDALCSLYESNDMWSDSLCCRLSQIKQLSSTLSDDQLAQRIFLLFEKYILLQKQHKASHTQTKALLILKIFEFWQQHVRQEDKLRDLERMCMQHIGDLGPSLSYILLHKGDELPPQYDVYRSTHPLILPFSHHFMLQITKEHINSMTKTRHERQISISNLQTQILRNMEKDLLEKEHKYVVMPNDVLRQSGEWFVFTCQHMYAKEDFTGRVLKMFYEKSRELIQIMQDKESKQGGGSNGSFGKEIEAIVLAIHFVEQEYRVHMRSGSGVCRQSCPVCIYNYLCSRVIKKGLLSANERAAGWTGMGQQKATLGGAGY